MSNDVKNYLIAEITTKTDPFIEEMVKDIVHDVPFSPLGVLFYGSVLRDVDYEGILDFYVITEKPEDLKKSNIARWCNTVLPPNVYYIEKSISGQKIRAKVAFLSISQFLNRSSLKSKDTTIWARFCQPVRLVWVRDEIGADLILEALARCVMTASCWAALLGPISGKAEAYWHALFTKTYAAELRVERKGRSYHLLQKQEERYASLLMLSWKRLFPRTIVSENILEPDVTEHARHKAQLRWKNIHSIGRALNFVRLVKAAFTFKDGVKYVVWKIQRHTGRNIQPSSFEEKHPIISLPILLWKFRVLKRDKKKP